MQVGGWRQEGRGSLRESAGHSMGQLVHKFHKPGKEGFFVCQGRKGGNEGGREGEERRSDRGRRVRKEGNEGERRREECVWI